MKLDYRSTSARFERSFFSREEFLSFLMNRPETHNPERIEHAATQLGERRAAFTRRFGWLDAKILGSNFREDILVADQPGRTFAILDLLDASTRRDTSAAVLTINDQPKFGRFVRTCYPQTICCMPTITAQAPDFKTLHVEPSGLGFASHTFDCVIFSETLHNVTDVAAALSEAARVLRNDGVLLATFPFACLDDASNPAAHDTGIYNESGKTLSWEILAQSRMAGFSDASMTYISHPEGGILGADLDGIFVLSARLV